MIKSFEPDSSHIKKITYDSDTESMIVSYKGGETYEFYNIPAKLFETLLTAPSAGRFMNDYIYGASSYTRLTKEV
jgi:hypothetical protein